jgi:hypothetical protein
MSLVLLLLQPCPGAGVDDGAAVRLRGGSAVLVVWWEITPPLLS